MDERDGGRAGASRTTVSEDTEITGQVKGASDIQFDGKLSGDLSCSGDVTVGEKAVVQGNLTVNSISVNGLINGNITARDKIALKATARVTGDIKAKRLSVEDGVTFVGKSEVNPSGAAGGQRPEAAGQQPAREERPGEEAADAQSADRRPRPGQFFAKK